MCHLTCCDPAKSWSQSNEAVGWPRAALELRRSRRAVARVPLRGKGDSISTGTVVAVSKAYGEGMLVPKRGFASRYSARLQEGGAPQTSLGKRRQGKVGFMHKCSEKPFLTEALEESVGVMKEELRKNNQEILLLKDSEQEMQDKLVGKFLKKE
ncbi:hypothetical protein NDU88_002548 [Pleurodeles waltl]|uniref:Uncharacterized protein n=1 Tax=Pleurodeles waltl TaxID=8319 RepID=A0AAV7T2Q0_PLEWA|nr:hypothetical protein NDU88_002548 [Pleurodeles waltl]